MIYVAADIILALLYYIAGCYVYFVRMSCTHPMAYGYDWLDGMITIPSQLL